jgi:lipoyl(octanoyl) transferase
LRGPVPEIEKSAQAVWLGRMDFLRALELQLRLCELKKRGFEGDFLLFVEHPPTITLGRNGDWRHLLVPAAVLRARGIAFHEIDRGGDITFHGPGQLVGYPILQLEKIERDVHRYMRNLEECLIRVLALYGIEADRAAKLTGVWVGESKIAAMGVHISRWITRHGFALNVQTDLSFYELMVPCGIVGRKVTSMHSVLQRALDLREVAEHLSAEFGDVFQRRVSWLSHAALQEQMERYALEAAMA